MYKDSSCNPTDVISINIWAAKALDDIEKYNKILNN